MLRLDGTRIDADSFRQDETRMGADFLNATRISRVGRDADLLGSNGTRMPRILLRWDETRIDADL